MEQTSAQRLATTIYEFRQAALDSPEAGAEYIIRHRVKADATEEEKVAQFVQTASDIAEQITGSRYQIPRSFESIVHSIHGEPAIRRALNHGYQKLGGILEPATARP